MSMSVHTNKPALVAMQNRNQTNAKLKRHWRFAATDEARMRQGKSCADDRVAREG